MITVSKDNTGDYTSIQEAVDAISSSTVSETIFIKNGTYNERVEITHNNITLIGESMDNVIITKDYYALMTMPDNTKRGTFRSYTFFVHANNFHAYNITFVNSSGFGTEVGQAIAVYAEGDNITFKNCKLLVIRTLSLPVLSLLKKNSRADLQVLQNSHQEFSQDNYMKTAL